MRAVLYGPPPACARSSPAACGTRSMSASPPTTIDMLAHPTVKGVTGDWLETDFAAWFRYHDPEAGHRQVTLDELVDGELAAMHERLVDAGIARRRPPRSTSRAGSAGWPGARSATPCWPRARGSSSSADELRWHVHPGGWADRLELGSPARSSPPATPGSDAEVVATSGSATSARCGRWRPRWSPLIDALRRARRARPAGPVGRGRRRARRAAGVPVRAARDARSRSRGWSAWSPPTARRGRRCRGCGRPTACA